MFLAHGGGELLSVGKYFPNKYRKNCVCLHFHHFISGNVLTQVSRPLKVARKLNIYRVITAKSYLQSSANIHAFHAEPPARYCEEN